MNGIIIMFIHEFSCYIVKPKLIKSGFNGFEWGEENPVCRVTKHVGVESQRDSIRNDLAERSGTQFLSYSPLWHKKFSRFIHVIYLSFMQILTLLTYIQAIMNSKTMKFFVNSKSMKWTSNRSQSPLSQTNSNEESVFSDKPSNELRPCSGLSSYRDDAFIMLLPAVECDFHTKGHGTKSWRNRIRTEEHEYIFNRREASSLTVQCLILIQFRRGT